MQINIFCLPAEFSEFLANATTDGNLSIFVATSKNQAFEPIKPEFLLDKKEAFEILVGRLSDLDKLKTKPAISLYREDRACFIDIRFGAISAKQLASSTCIADKSDVSEIFSKAMRKILKAKASMGVIDVSTGQPPGLKFYCTEGAAKSGRTLVEFLGGEPEFRPALAAGSR